jgi:ribonuclease D
MPDQTSLDVTVKTAGANQSDHVIVQWPMSFKIESQGQQITPGASHSHRWWTHKLYRGPEDKPVQILYSKTKEQSETIAQQFLDEPVLGFDMEWPWPSTSHRLQDKIGLIQLACEDKIALFHIGLHVGNKTDDLIASTLRKIIEDKNIAKTGVGVLSADFPRLIRFFNLQPKGAFELSSLHRLVKFGAWKPAEVTTKLTSLAHQVEDHLGLPLLKDEVRTSNWSKALSPAQITYAAADAYAGFMLYHCMNAKRLAMKRVPPLPVCVDTYLPARFAPIQSLRLHSEDSDTGFITAEDFFATKTDDTSEKSTTTSNQAATKSGAEDDGSKVKKDKVSLDATSQAMLEQLLERRKVLSAAQNLPPYRIATTSVIENIARQRPIDEASLYKIKGVGKLQVEKYGKDWLEVIQLFTALNDIQPSLKAPSTTETETTAFLDLTGSVIPTTPTTVARRKFVKTTVGELQSPSSPPAFVTPLGHTPQLHTGLSFTFAETNLESETDKVANKEDSSDNSTEFATSLSRPPSELKRKRSRDLTTSKPPSPAVTQAKPVNPELRVYRNKLLAFSKLVTTKLRPPPLQPIVTDETLDLIVLMMPKTEHELDQVPDIARFVEACRRVEKDLFRHVLKFAPVQKRS